MANIDNKCWLIIVIALIGFSCQVRSQEKWSKDMEIRTYHGGGMMPESKTVIITDSTCTYIHWRIQERDTLAFTLSKQELDDLLNEINATHFRNIVSGERGPQSIVWDMASTSVNFKWSSQSHEVSVGATEEIKQGLASGFFKLYNYILSLAEKKTAK